MLTRQLEADQMRASWDAARSDLAKQIEEEKEKYCLLTSDMCHLQKWLLGSISVIYLIKF